MDNHERFTIGQIAKKMGVSVRMLQYYDKEGIFKPSYVSEGGRRLYSNKDILKLYQILTLKYLGFSLEDIKCRLYDLETPEQVVYVLERQQELLEAQIQNLHEVLDSIMVLRTEALRMDEVDFGKYADIVSMVKLGVNHKDLWVINAFDNAFHNHLKTHFSSQPELGLQIMETYLQLLDEGIVLKREEEPYDSLKSMEYAKRWWEMVHQFTGGDMSLLPKLYEFNTNKHNWDDEISVKQNEIDDFLNKVLEYYLSTLGETL